MSKYLEKQFPLVENGFDGHIHMHRWIDEETGEEFLHGLEGYRKECNLKYIALAPLPSGRHVPVFRDVSNNIICAFYKLLNENTFSYGGFIYPTYPATNENMAGMSLLEQYKELKEIGFDGIKMLEGKPNLYKMVNNPLDSEFFAPVFEKMEKDKTYILMHACDPHQFWVDVDEECKQKGWFYGDGTYPSDDEIYAQIDNVLRKYPKLNLCLAHFFFLSENPEKLSNMLDTYKNLTVDLTPGGEMYIGFDKRKDYFKDFFVKYDDRICFGTDMDFPARGESGIWLCDRVYRYLATNETLSSFDDHMLQGIQIPTSSLQKIFSQNLLNKLGGSPKPINKEALKRYIEKYKHLIIDKRLTKRIEDLSKEYL
ncbi:MAG: amidohydrolase family protein [Clostridia bacterium]|nr:amidohydrolase family protein [Clostridia bacterium]